MPNPQLYLDELDNRADKKRAFYKELNEIIKRKDMEENKITNTATQEEYDKENEGKIVLKKTLNLKVLRDMIAHIDATNDKEPTFEITATDPDTLEEYLVSIKLKV